LWRLQPPALCAVHARVYGFSMEGGITYQWTLVKACLIVGDELKLAQRLGATVEDVVNWLLGDVPVPMNVFLAAVDIALADNKEQIASNVALIEQIRRRHRYTPKATKKPDLEP
jgi:hypothetical protein